MRTLPKNALGALILAWIGCGGTTNQSQAQCEAVITNSCARREECTKGMTKASDCAAENHKTIDCASPDLSCSLGKVYSLDVATQCAAALLTASCADVLAGTVMPCPQVCK